MMMLHWHDALFSCVAPKWGSKMRAVDLSIQLAYSWCGRKDFLLDSSSMWLLVIIRNFFGWDSEMLSQKIIDDIGGKVSEVIAKSPAKELERNMRAMLQSAFSRLDLVTREEFDVQQEVLLRTREKLEQLETRLAILEARQSDFK
jgi:BMFP domain-containing protein YqiC